MNKRIAQFLSELIEEIERLESKLSGSKLHNDALITQMFHQKKEISALKVKLRKLNKELNTKNTK